MKKTKIVLLALFIGAMFFGCQADDDPDPYDPYANLYSTLTLNNTPAGASFYVLVYNSNSLPATQAEYSSMTTSSIAAASGTSPFRLVWPNGKKTGTFFTIFQTGSTRKYSLIQFNSGNATVDWNSLTTSSFY
jgi:hypothetical protein